MPKSRGQRGPFALTLCEAFDYIAASRAGAFGPDAASFIRKAVRKMSRRCELTGVGPMIGHHVSHSNVKSKRRFLPALVPASLQSEVLGQTFSLRITNAALRTVDFRGGLDAFLLKASDEQLSLRARKIKRQIKAKQAAAAAAA